MFEAVARRGAVERHAQARERLRSAGDRAVDEVLAVGKLDDSRVGPREGEGLFGDRRKQVVEAGVAHRDCGVGLDETVEHAGALRLGLGVASRRADAVLGDEADDRGDERQQHRATPAGARVRGCADERDRQHDRRRHRGHDEQNASPAADERDPHDR